MLFWNDGTKRVIAPNFCRATCRVRPDVELFRTICVSMATVYGTSRASRLAELARVLHVLARITAAPDAEPAWLVEPYMAARPEEAHKGPLSTAQPWPRVRITERIAFAKEP